MTPTSDLEGNSSIHTLTDLLVGWPRVPMTLSRRRLSPNTGLKNLMTRFYYLVWIKSSTSLPFRRPNVPKCRETWMVVVSFVPDGVQLGYGG